MRSGLIIKPHISHAQLPIQYSNHIQPQKYKKRNSNRACFRLHNKKQAISAVGKLILLARRHSTAHRSGDIQIQVPTYTST